MKSSFLRPSLLLAATCILAGCPGFLSAQSTANKLNSIQHSIPTDLNKIQVQQGFSTSDCLTAINYTSSDSESATLSATTSAAKNTWLQCPDGAPEGRNAVMYFNRTALDKPLANPWAGGAFGRKPSITPMTSPVSAEITGPPLKP